MGPGTVYSEEGTFEGGVVSCTSLPTPPIFQLTHGYEKRHEQGSLLSGFLSASRKTIH